MFIRPALDPASETEGARLRVRDPETMQFLADDGEEKPVNEYWLRRMAEGGIEARVDGDWPVPDENLPTTPDTHEETAA